MKNPPNYTAQELAVLYHIAQVGPISRLLLDSDTVESLLEKKCIERREPLMSQTIGLTLKGRKVTEAKR